MNRCMISSGNGLLHVTSEDGAEERSTSGLAASERDSRVAEVPTGQRGHAKLGGRWLLGKSSADTDRHFR
jgi:hypothetical protein